MTIYHDLRIERRINGKPYGIRDRNGYLLFFLDVEHFDDQERYEREIAAQEAMAQHVLAALGAQRQEPT